MEMRLTLFKKHKQSSIEKPKNYIKKSKFKDRRAYIIFGLILILLTVTACANKESKEEVTLFAASSLTDAVMDIEKIFEEHYTDKDLKVNFAGSKTLRTQLENGAKADIFLSANETHYKALLDQGIILEGTKLFTNEMVLVVSKEASDKVLTLEDLQKEHRLILGDVGVPAGDYSREIICRLGALYGKEYETSVLNNLVSSESNVRQVLMKIVLGEGDAAIVYKTDITENIYDKVNIIEIPKDYNVTANYWMGIVNNGMISESVDACCQFLLDDKSCEIFENYGFCISE